MKLNKIRGYRVMIGLSQVYMANLLNISQYSYNRKELGITPFKDNEKIKEIYLRNIFLVLHLKNYFFKQKTV